MSIAADMKIEDLLRRVAALERQLAELMAALTPTPPVKPQEPRNGARR
jgi:hypothetical protein